jgi:hypothetical protein
MGTASDRVLVKRSVMFLEISSERRYELGGCARGGGRERCKKIPFCLFLIKNKGDLAFESFFKNISVGIVSCKNVSIYSGVPHQLSLTGDFPTGMKFALKLSSKIELPLVLFHSKGCTDPSQENFSKNLRFDTNLMFRNRTGRAVSNFEHLKPHHQHHHSTRQRVRDEISLETGHFIFEFHQNEYEFF